jgi:hypothetical protein
MRHTVVGYPLYLPQVTAEGAVYQITAQDDGGGSSYTWRVLMIDPDGGSGVYVLPGVPESLVHISANGSATIAVRDQAGVTRSVILTEPGV